MDVREMIKHQRKAYYTQLTKAPSKGIKVAYCCAWGPTEPLYAMDIIPAFPENYAVVASAKRQVVRFLEEAESRGMSKDFIRMYFNMLTVILYKTAIPGAVTS